MTIWTAGKYRRINRKLSMSNSNLFHWIYISTATEFLTEPGKLELLKHSRTRNQSLDATGMLLYGNQSFIQVLEAGKDNLRVLQTSIRQDTRHQGIITLKDEAIEERVFPDWQMGFADRDQDEEEFLRQLDGLYDFAGIDEQQGYSWQLLQSFRKHSGNSETH